MNIPGIAVLAIAATTLAGCASDWEARRSVVPTATTVPEYRAGRGVGNLRRLAILPVRVAGAAVPLPVDLAPEEARSRAWSEAQDIASRLRDGKGYEVVLIGGEEGTFRSEAVKHPEFGTAAALEAQWRAANTPEKIAEAIRRIGRAVDADGLVAAFTVHNVPVSEAERNVYSALAVLTFFAPMFYHLSRTTQEVVIYETQTGEVVWRGSARGEAVSGPRIDVLRDLENAVPAAVIAP